MIATAHLYHPLHHELLTLLRSLRGSEWQKPTVCAGWSVQDIALHILDTQIRILSMGRDGYQPPPPDPPITSYDGLVGFLNGLNADWTRATRRVSPQVLVELLAVTGPQLAEHVMSLAPHVPALFPVAWAGHETSPNWFDIGRNYTEYWHHQQQIRDAVGALPLTSHEWLHPMLAILLHALPRAYASVTAVEGTEVRIAVSGDAGGVWTLCRDASGWNLIDSERDGAPSATIQISDGDAWRFLTKGLSAESIRPGVTCVGDSGLTEPFFNALAVMA